MADDFHKHFKSLESPPDAAFDIVPSDTEDLDRVPRAINVATSGRLRVTMGDGSIVTLTVVAGMAFPLRPVRVWATGTTATQIVGLY
ncbi:hypothetical protein [Maritimibacter sp. DP1N21-5]|uniref:spike base protein, RCAP_Rcc01079 family n=1 Tax=Maritimibacter sp. DP1N21-5 TaxID=2836867 RepID=UPI001C48F885|nr:hypothetical protein [Maritimibacter sp. DP1N21-5]MBV7407493.1 hypothetical protein [Maritimibacter sp. DP1N21-5]